MNPQKLALEIAKVLHEKQAKDITVLQVDHLTSVTDYFVIATGRSTQRKTCRTSWKPRKSTRAARKGSANPAGSCWIIPA